MHFFTFYMLYLEVLYSTLSCVLPIIYQLKRMHVYMDICDIT